MNPPGWRYSEMTRRLGHPALPWLGVCSLVAFILLALPGCGQGGCESDGDCKGDRICEKGQCVAPTSSGCQKDTDCKGDRVCEKGVCVGPSPAAATAGATDKAGAEATCARAKVTAFDTWKEVLAETEEELAQSKKAVNDIKSKLRKRRARLIEDEPYDNCLQWANYGWKGCKEIFEADFGVCSPCLSMAKKLGYSEAKARLAAVRKFRSQAKRQQKVLEKGAIASREALEKVYDAPGLASLEKARGAQTAFFEACKEVRP